MLHVTVPTDPDKRRSSGLSRELVLHAALQIIDTRVLGLVLNKVQKEDEDRYGYGYEYTYDKIQASEPVRAKAAALVAPAAGNSALC